MAVFLLNVGADVSLQAKNGCTAFDMASLIGECRLLLSLHSHILDLNFPLVSYRHMCDLFPAGTRYPHTMEEIKKKKKKKRLVYHSCMCHVSVFVFCFHVIRAQWWWMLVSQAYHISEAV